MFWISDAWACLDGHHRLAAIRGLNAGPAATVAVEVFTGTLDAVMLEATLRNSQNKLEMRETDKTERAWKLYLLGSGPHEAIATACGVSTKTVQRMARVVKKLGVTSDAMEMIRERPVHPS